MVIQPRKQKRHVGTNYAFSACWETSQSLRILPVYQLEEATPSAKNKAGNTARVIYPDWMKLKDKRTTDANGCKLQWVWNKYYENSSIADIPLESMDAATLEEWFLDVIKENHLIRRQFMEVKSVINMIFDHAIKKNVVSTNIARNIRGFEYKLFEQPKKKSVCEQIYVHDDKARIMKEAMTQFEKTGNTAYLAAILNFFWACVSGNWWHYD